MTRSRSRALAMLTGAVCALSSGIIPAHAGNDFSQEAKAQFTSDIIAFTNARPNGIGPTAGICGRMRSSLEAYGNQMPKWAVSGETDLCAGIDGLNTGTDKTVACKAIGKAIKTFDKVNIRAEDNQYIFTYVSFTAAIDMVSRDHCA